jgi:hypothetical protein
MQVKLVKYPLELFPPAPDVGGRERDRLRGGGQIEHRLQRLEHGPDLARRRRGESGRAHVSTASPAHASRA